ncbi:MAG: hypothetical protein FWF49_01860 [Oscillospiraceae bacterium]|nr:hypothetical protein [Oscillospiraceae bacterium]
MAARKTRDRKQTKKRRNLILRIAVLLLVVYVGITLIQLQGDVNAQKQKQAALDAAIAEQALMVSDMQEKVSNPQEYLEQKALEAGNAAPGSQVYKESTGG